MNRENRTILGLIGVVINPVADLAVLPLQRQQGKQASDLRDLGGLVGAAGNPAARTNVPLVAPEHLKAALCNMHI